MKKFSVLSLLLLLCTLNLHAEKNSHDALKLHVRKAGTLRPKGDCPWQADAAA